MHFDEQGDAAFNEAALLFAEKEMDEYYMMQEILEEENKHKLTKVRRGSVVDYSPYLHWPKKVNDGQTKNIFLFNNSSGRSSA